MKSGFYEVTVLVNDKPVREYDHEGNLYIEGRKGSEFKLKFRNLSSKRVLVVPAVDGLSVMDGKPASEQSRGYIVGGYGNVVIPGWRLDNDNVAKFLFKDRKGSFNEQTAGDNPEQTKNVGVIGFLVFEEEEAAPQQTIHHYWPQPVYRPRPWWDQYPYYPNDYIRTYGIASDNTRVTCGIADLQDSLTPSSFTATAQAAGTVTANNAASGLEAAVRRVQAKDEPVYHGMVPPKAGSAYNPLSYEQDTFYAQTTAAETTLAADEPESFSLGTAFGDKGEHKVTQVDFKKKSTIPAATLVLFYDSRRNLERRGIQVVAEHDATTAAAPNPFPAMTGGCTPPAGWSPSGNT